jgi:23S rRNA pseudouridine955/2504/2580 synthase
MSNAPSKTAQSVNAGVRMVTVLPEYDGQRLDNFLLRELKGVPKSRIYRLLRKGEVRVNGKRIKPDYRVIEADVVRIPPIRVSEQVQQTASAGLKSLLADAILFENDHFIIVNKPAGLAVHGGSGISLGLIETLRQLRPEARFLELVHRLDRDTSGCLLVAKKPAALKYFHELLRQEHQIDKVYLALVVGRWANRQKKIDAPLRKNELSSGERIVRVAPDGKPSLTEFSTRERFGDIATLVEAKPITGRTHQIRVHTQFAGHPIVGDEKYADERAEELAEEIGLQRLFLHAERLSFEWQDETITVTASLPKALRDAIKECKKFSAIVD